MENIMMLPASYCVMNEEEMTYTSGGANIVQAAAAGFIPFYGWFAGVAGVRDYRKSHPKDWTSTGPDALTRYMDKSVANAFYGLGCTFWTVSSCFTGVGLLINALVIFS